MTFNISSQCSDESIVHIVQKTKCPTAVQAVFQKWSLPEGAKEEREVMSLEIQESHPEAEIISLDEEENGDFLSWETNPLEGVLRRHSKEGVLWKRTFLPGTTRHHKFSFGLVAISGGYAIINVKSGNDFHLEICDLKTGETFKVNFLLFNKFGSGSLFASCT
jgi:hypothetical protein